MSQVLITESHLEDIGDAIRSKNGEETQYLPSEMANKIINIPNSYTAQDEGKVVVNGELVGQTNRTINENGIYDTTLNNEIIVSTQGGGNDWPFLTEIVDGESSSLMGKILGSVSLDITKYPQNVQTFYSDYARTKPTTVDYDVTISSNDKYKTLSQFLDSNNPTLALEYYGNVYDNTSMIGNLGLVLLGDFSQGGQATGNVLSDSINNYSAIVLQGIYQKQRTSGYNTTFMYCGISLNVEYWAGMKDRNDAYDCFVTFTDDTTVSLRNRNNYRQVIIYGMP